MPTKQQRTKEEQMLILSALISERKLIIKTIEDELEERILSLNYREALISQINNHIIAIKEYNLGLEKLKQ